MNIPRRSLGILVCFGPVFLCVLSYLVNSHLEWKTQYGPIFLGLAIPFVLLNLYLVGIRPRWHLWRNGSFDGMRNVSGIGLLSTVLVTMAIVADFGDAGIALVGLLILVLDPLGLPWFLILTWQDRSLWDDTRAKNE
jgi:hypothetical protein